MKTIVFVCTGNTCRSPMAEGIMRQMLREYGIEDVNVTSCGLYVGDELRGPAAEKAVRAVRSLYGVDISAHRTRSLAEVMALPGDLLFIGLTKGHAHDLVTKHHVPEDKVLAMDVNDPFNEMEYQEAAIDIHYYLVNNFKMICE